MHYTRLRVLCPSVVFFSLFMLSVEFVRSWAMFLYLSVLLASHTRTLKTLGFMYSGSDPSSIRFIVSFIHFHTTESTPK